jgi:hypothetical protein
MFNHGLVDSELVAENVFLGEGLRRSDHLRLVEVLNIVIGSDCAPIGP